MKRDYGTVNRSPINNSTSKQLISFPKADRFGIQKRPMCDQFYNLRGSLIDQNRSMGYGTKTRFGQPFNQPAPGSYTSRSDFQDNKQKERGHSFGSESKKYRLANEDDSKKKPGPNHYRVKSDLKYPSLSYTLGGKPHQTRTSFKNFAGPGQYETLGMSSTGQYFYSKFNNSGSPKFTRAQRFQSHDRGVPGPGKYRAEDSAGMSKTGFYFNSKYHTSNVRSFSKLQRLPSGRIRVSPGPGTYERFSDFADVNK